MVSEIQKRQEWNAILARIDNYDCYHTYEYSRINRKLNETPILLVYEANKVLIALPLLIREIPETSFFDCTSVYGYPGPVCSNYAGYEDFENFQEELKHYFHQKKIISVFSRLNPFIENQEQAICNLVTIKKLSYVVSIDLTKKTSQQRQLFSSTTKRYLNRARRLLYVKRMETVSSNDLDIFTRMYFENMKRVYARESYFFVKQYFAEMVTSQELETELYYAILKENHEIVSAMLIIKSDMGVHYHLSGTNEMHLYLSPARLLIDEVRLAHSNSGLNFFNLGGGLGSKKDNLFYFKSSFSDDYKRFKIWKYIVNEKVYHELSSQVQNQNDGYFPAYRN